MVFTDQLQRPVELHFPLKRIISLVPSQTELLFYLGLSDSIAGITKFCVHPQGLVKIKPVIGGTKNFRLDVIDKIQPDLIIGNKEENYPEGIKALTAKYPVWMSDINSIDDALKMIGLVGEITNTSSSAGKLVSEIELAIAKIIQPKPVTVVYLIWKSPWMAAGKNTFIHSWMEQLGLKNVVSSDRYPALSTEQIQQLHPQLVLLSSEPYPFNSGHCQELRSMLPHAKIMLVDGEMFSWYGSRMLQAAAYFNSLDL